MTQSKVTNAFRVLALIVVFCQFLPAQESSGQLVGVVTDASQASVPGVTVTIAHSATGITRSTTTDNYGDYLFAGLPIGDYNVTAVAPGFATVRHTGITVAIGLPTKLDFELQLAKGTEHRRL